MSPTPVRGTLPTRQGAGLLLTGGSGRLGRELKELITGVDTPGREELDITREDQASSYISRTRPSVVVHAAAYTDVQGAERDRVQCWRVNVSGTRHIALACRQAGAKLVFISTDYVFDGSRGDYREEDVLGPARNYYALTKIVAEEIARTVQEHLILRTSFRPRRWPYDTAFTDVFTSQEYVDVLAPEIALAATNALHIDYDVLHVAGRRKSVYELARQRKPDVTPASKESAGVPLPDDVSLNTDRWTGLRKDLLELREGSP